MVVTDTGEGFEGAIGTDDLVCTLPQKQGPVPPVVQPRRQARLKLLLSVVMAVIVGLAIRFAASA